ncbi:MAG: ATP-binding cassette domain-containing protein [Bacteroidales bacterium]|nr:ATP-binding cassette domain-containing protein [Bacteroidales bacterium]
MKKNQESSFRWLTKRVREALPEYISASVLNFLSAICFVGFSWFLAAFAALWLENDLIQTKNLLYASLLLGGRYVFAYFASILNYKSGNIIVSSIKRKIYPALLNNSETDSVSASLLVTRISDDLKPYFSFFIPYAVSSALVGILILTVSFYFEPWVGISLLITFIVIPFQMIMIGVGAESLHKKHINLFMKYSAVFYNRLQTIAEIVNLDNLNRQYNFLSRKSKDLNKATTSVMRVAILSSAVLELFVSIAIAAVAIYLGMSLLGIMPGPNYGKGYDFHIALFLLILAPYLFFYLRKFVSAYHDKNKALASAKLIMPLLKQSNHTSEKVEKVDLQSLQIKDLSFAYTDSPVKVLNNINIELPKKGLVLVKGISGSGKSTLLKILSGNLYVIEGTISVNAKSNQWSLEWLRFNSSYMNQYPFIFDGTIAYNVFLEDKNNQPHHYPDFLDKIISKKEDSWQTELTHNGKQLSGGEKQLITLARMMLYPKPVAILDEPTANLDSETVEIILGQIEKMSREKLLIVASHEDKFDKIANLVLNLNWGEQIKDE